ncbi:MAG: hypothetical protein Q4D96_05155 [Propionibacteriaceae bacterium]|nr:hypothetical protein [Propionibacteriaceae bacterium]
MNETLASLLDLQARIHRFQVDTLEADPDIEDLARVEFSLGGELLDLRFHGECHDDFPDREAGIDDDETNYPLIAFMTWLCEPGNAERVRSLRFDGPDEGANGVKAWEFIRLLASDVVLPRLLRFEVGLTDPGDHNLSLISAGADFDHDEGGAVAALLGRMPALRELTVPSAPNAAFFDGPPHPLMQLRLQCGIAHQGFIANLSRSSRFPDLVALDHAEWYDLLTLRAADEAELAGLFTGLEDFSALLGSRAGRRIRHLKLRGTRLSQAELQALQAQAPRLQLLHIPQEGSRYISHL